MMLRRVFAHVSCRNIEASAAWYRTLFDRPEDRDPMAGLKEWHHGAEGGLQLFSNHADAGRGCVTFIVRDLPNERARLIAAGIPCDEMLQGDEVAFLQIADPDGNRVVLAEPAR